jgi:DNA (cytosine-5)-methyltransferase 1
MKVVELFAGIGSQTKALKNKNIKHEVVGISEWSINSIISYGEIHSDDIKYNISKDDMVSELSKYTFSLDTKKPYNIKKLKDDKLSLLYKNHKNSKNLGSIVDLKGLDVPNCDLLTYSFPCQDLSLQGKQKGLFEGNTSSLLWQVGRILNEMKDLPTVLLMENVPSILNDKHKPGFDKWKDFLEEKGYINYVLKLKGTSYGSAQNRERCFMISSLKNMDGIESDILSTTKPSLKIKDILQNNIETKYYKPNLEKFLANNWTFKESKSGIISYTLEGYTNFVSEAKLYSIDSVSPTITATGAQSRIKIIDNDRIRFLTPLELWLLMGFTKSDFDKVKDLHSDVELSKQAGNSIVVNVLEVIFENINKHI